ncbi:hypothetical protein ACJ2_31610 [Pantoea sp. QMID2]|nr:hypothetical protein ACJ1_35010 [Pantoea sp. QMID1]GME44338.1 hypothetical protein ACJ3_35220 [Pantoea sp. QMID3]GME58923.1 hypothetical protein ACJ4_31530 [Pantoea sp. QMID4]GME60354.1 hypothetical protein ACJ2_31610 [Pantoea sp. QMID2]
MTFQRRKVTLGNKLKYSLDGRPQATVTRWVNINVFVKHKAQAINASKFRSLALSMIWKPLAIFDDEIITRL